MSAMGAALVLIHMSCVCHPCSNLVSGSTFAPVSKDTRPPSEDTSEEIDLFHSWLNSSIQYLLIIHLCPVSSSISESQSQVRQVSRSL